MEVREQALAQQREHLLAKDFAYLSIAIPPGQGKDVDLVLWRGGQPSEPVKLSYAAPTITSVENSGGTDARYQI